MMARCTHVCIYICVCINANIYIMYLCVFMCNDGKVYACMYVYIYICNRDIYVNVPI